MRKLKVVHLTSVHSPADVRIFHRQCRSLADAGYETVLVVPTGKDYVSHGVQIRAVPVPGDRRERFLRTTRQVLAAAVREDADLYHFHDPELIPVGLLLKARGKRVVYDVHENVPGDVLTKQYLHPVVRRAASLAAHAAQGIAAASLDGIVAAYDSIGRAFPPAKVAVVNNFPRLRDDGAERPYRPYEGRPARLAYAGVISRKRGLAEMVAAVGMLPEGLGARMTLAGAFSPPELEREAASLPGWDRVDSLGWRTRDEVAAQMEEARIGLVLFHPGPNHNEAQPNKLFEYMAAGTPVIASDFPLWRGIVEGSGCGVLVDPLDPAAIAAAMRRLLENPEAAAEMGRRGLAAVHERYSWEAEQGNLLALYERILGPFAAETR
jgi:glycosyltransferase involved in cell wall biosynthesis